MIFSFSQSLLLSFSMAATVKIMAAAANTNPSFVQPEVIDYDELLRDYDAQKQDNLTLTPPIIELELDWMNLDLPNVPGLEEKPFLTRALGGSFPGPTIAASAGTTLRIRFKNKLEAQPESVKNSDNDIDDPDTANLHFHGGHVTSKSPGDDVSHIRVGPGESFVYELPIPDEHAPGTQWIHPHHHGSTSLHVGGGASLAFVVKDPPGYLPNQLDLAPEKIMVFQDFDMVKLEQMTKRANDKVLRGSLLEAIEASLNDDEKHRFVTINGKYRPTLEVPQDEWQRWRIVFAGWRTNRLDFRAASPEVNADGNGADCEFRLLAKDGIYISDFPRKVASLPIAAGGRADIMVRCRGKPGKTSVFEAIGREVLTVKTVSNDIRQDGNDSNDELAPWSPAALPEYLLDLSSTKATPGCSCETHFSGEGGEALVNGLHYQSGHFLHTSYLGAVVERHLSFEGEHSYHQHMYPFQIVALDHGDNGENGNGHEDSNGDTEFEPFLRMGDWHDSYHGSEELKSATIRYKPTVLSGDLVLHCHNNIHSDRGMLAKEYVLPDDDNGECRCDVFGPVIVDKGDDGAGNESPDGFIGENGEDDAEDADVPIVDGAKGCLECDEEDDAGEVIATNANTGVEEEFVDGSEEGWGESADGANGDNEEDVAYVADEPVAVGSEGCPECDGEGVAGESIAVDVDTGVQDESVGGSEGSWDEDKEDEADPIPDESSNSVGELDELFANTQQQEPFPYSGGTSKRQLNRRGMAIIAAFSIVGGLLLGFFY